ncbi:Rieske 2Fe-2S domain-containing protein [Pigmentiphaga soli]|uniref:Rieske 2Fe-2S domain-containing protein n=1 Tax=Pigmentiphaga soli TaxID=1007095 RepID=A0ABP8GQ57_9BURK
MLTPEDNRLLTRVGPDTPMGRLFRRFWLPVLLASELPEPDCPPVRVRILCEDLVAFRDSSGRVGLLDEHCPHRRASLFLGRNEEDGIRCVFHGWKFDATGRCVDLPSVENGAALKNRVRIAAYPTREFGGYVWCYMGPPEHQPELPRMEFGLVAPQRRFITKRRQFANWAQAAEGILDPTHFSYLHIPISRNRDAWGKMMYGANFSTTEVDPRLRWVVEDGCPSIHVRPLPNDLGMTVAGKRRADGDDAYWRIIQFLMPSTSLAPGSSEGENYHGQTVVPIDDENAWVFSYTWNPERELTEQERKQLGSGSAVHPALDDQFTPKRNRANDYLIDRELQKTQTYSGIVGIGEQDTAINESQGVIYDRSKEFLVASDAGIARMRKLWLETARKLADGIEPVAPSHPDGYKVRSGNAVCPGSMTLEEVMVRRFGHVHGHLGSMYDGGAQQERAAGVPVA